MASKALKSAMRSAAAGTPTTPTASYTFSKLASTAPEDIPAADAIYSDDVRGGADPIEVERMFEDIYDNEFYVNDADPAGWNNQTNDNATNRSHVTIPSMLELGNDTAPPGEAPALTDANGARFTSATASIVYGLGKHGGVVDSAAAAVNNAAGDMTAAEIESLSSSAMSLLYAELARKRIDGHQIDSMNHFYREGVAQIITNVFDIRKTVKYDRGDSDITEITYAVVLSDVELSKPTTHDSHGRVTPLTPNMAHVQGIPYNLSIYVNIEVTMTATYGNGGTKTRRETITRHKIASIPCCVGSIMCATGDLTREGKKALREDPIAPNGYFILKNGNMWNMEAGENLVNNTFHVYKVRHRDEEARGTFLSKPGDAFENSYQVIVKLLTSGAIVLEMTTNKDERIEIPFYLMFRALGMNVDRDIVDHVVHGADNTDPTSITLKKLLERAFSVRNGDYEEVNDVLDPVIVLQFIANKFKAAADKNAAKKNINVQKYMVQSFVALIDKIFFPHIGVLPADRVRKLRFLAHLIRELLSVYCGISASTDRDSYQNKRVHAAGIAFAKTFKTKFNLSVVLSIHHDMARAIKSTPYDKIMLADVVRNAINKADLDKALVKAMSPSKKGAGAPPNAKLAARISTNQIYHKNDLNVVAAINTISTPNPPVGKSNERARDLRQNQPSYWGFICVQASPDTGEGVGMNKVLAISASISGSTSSVELKRVLRDDKTLISTDVRPADIARRALALVVVNGDPIGYTESAHEFAARYRAMRRAGDRVHRRTSIVWELRTRRVSFWTDYGRLHRPLICVYNNVTEYEEVAMAGKPIPFRQWIKLNMQHIRGLEDGTLTIGDLEAEGVIEYLTPEEVFNCYIARSIDYFYTRSGDELHQFTHVDIPQAILGPTALACPASNHSNTYRNTMQHNHRKQACGWYSLNFPYIIEKNTTFQHYVEQPLISTFTDRITTPTGHNIIVALDCRAGNNAEDSIQCSSSAADRGYWAVSQFNFEKSELERSEIFGMPDATITANIKREANYAGVDGITARVGSVVCQNDVLIVKVVKMPKADNNGNRYKDASTLNRRIEPARVVNVVRAHNGQAEFIRVKIESYRPIGDGDKLSSRTGNKGIVSITTPACDMPYTEDGLGIDLLVNAHSMPTRMALNQMIEAMLGIYAARLGCNIDATAFRSIDVRGVVDQLATMGVKYAGHRRVYSGITGEPIDTLLFIGPTNYQRLEKFVIDEQYAIRSGPTSALTRQPQQGKAHAGGLRIGEMEKDTLCAQGSMQALYEKLWRDSDGTYNVICTTCGNPAIFNEQKSIYWCKGCDNKAVFARINTTWSANLMHHRLTSMGVAPEFVFESNSYSQ